MEKPNTRLHDENNGLDYVLFGDYYFPALILAEDSCPVGRWGRMHKRYLKEHHPVRYQVLLLSGRLNSYLADIDAQAEEQLELLTPQMAERERVNEELKAANQMEWARRMNSIQNRAEEVIKAELIFA
ncbi:TnpV protein [Faecalibacterium prausnitzii]|uniref:TnpV protein n=1 Tax=Faecalibacterium prausnitzii TaxID=853 RepID=UPI0035627F96